MGRPRKLLDALPPLTRTYKRFWPYVRRERPLLASSLAALFAAVALQLLEPWPLKFIFDRIIPIDDPEGLAPIAATEWFDTSTLLALSALGLVIITALRAVAEYWNRIGFAIAGNRVLAQVRGELYSHLQGLSLSFHNRARSGDLVVRVIGDVTQLRDVVVTALLPLMANVLILVGMVAVMFLLEWRLALLALAVVPLFGLTTLRLSSRIHQVARKQRQRQGAMAAAVAESIGAVKVIQALSLEAHFAESFSGQSQQDLKQSVKGARLTASLERTVDVLVAVGTALVLWYGARLVLRGQLTPGSLIVFLTYLKRAFRPARDFAKYSGRLSKAAASGERVLELLDRAPDVVDLPDAAPAPPLRGRIRFEEVRFAYEPGRPVLDRMTLEIPAGRRVAVVGPSGIGKSTLLNLLLRLYDPQEGRVMVDGRDIRQYTVNSLRAQISIVLQDNLLFAANVWDNIAHGGFGASREEIETAARLANAHDFILNLPDGYETVLGERGVTLSHGQRQRIAIARAAVRRAPVLLLDEPCAGLDRPNERSVMEALERLSAGRTTLLVTHDLLQAASADEIIYLDHGHVLEHGAHADLLNMGGRYASLYRLQSAEQDPQVQGGRQADAYAS